MLPLDKAAADLLFGRGWQKTPAATAWAERGRARRVCQEEKSKVQKKQSTSASGARKKKQSTSASGARKKKQSTSASGARKKKQSTSASGARKKKQSTSASGARKKKQSTSASGARKKKAKVQKKQSTSAAALQSWLWTSPEVKPSTQSHRRRCSTRLSRRSQESPSSAGLRLRRPSRMLMRPPTSQRRRDCDDANNAGHGLGQGRRAGARCGGSGVGGRSPDRHRGSVKPRTRKAGGKEVQTCRPGRHRIRERPRTYRL